MKERNEIEGGFGVGKRRYGLARIMACLKETSESVIMLQFLVINLDRRLRSLFCRFLRTLLGELFGQNADKKHSVMFFKPFKVAFGNY
jgi:IS5 family transposase